MEVRVNHLIYYSIIAMMISLFFSRLILSVAAGIFFILCFFHPFIKLQLKKFFSTPLLWGISLLFIIPLLSGLWSADKQEWSSIIRIKLPLLLMPIAFAAPFKFSRKQWHRLAFVFLILVTAGTIWSMLQYIRDPEAAHEGYLHARSILTPLLNDHVRFSWIVALAFLVSCWVLKPFWNRRMLAIGIIINACWLIVYLHILAARTGLVAIYIVLFSIAAWALYKQKKKISALIPLVLIIALPVVAYVLFPTFRNKVRYFYYDFKYFKDAQYLPGGNDASRVISWKAGLAVTNNNKFSGVGFGDVCASMNDWYDRNHPGMTANEKILPSNQWLMYGAGSGVIAMLIFSWVLFVPFITNTTNRWNWWVLNMIVAISFLFDIGLEVQFGVFIYCMTILLCWKRFHIEN